MKQIFKFFTASLLLVAIIIGCSKSGTTTPVTPTTTAPVSDFSYSGTGPAPATVIFTNTSTNATTYTWDFGDNGTSTSASPSHMYTAAGTYTVKLTATGSGGSTTTTKTVNIGAAYTKVKITKVTIVNIPLPGGWDSGSGPDVYFQIQDQNSSILFNAGSSSRVNDITTSMLPVSWTLTTPFEITDFTTFRYIELFDYNPWPLSDTDMGWVAFKMSNYTSGSNPYPSSVTSTNTQNGFTITLNLTWQ